MMTLAEQRRRAHIERQRRLGLTVAARPMRSGMVQAPPLVPELAASQAEMIAALQEEVTQLSVRLAKEREDLSPLTAPSRIKPVISVVAKYYGMSLRDIASSRRTRGLIRPRQVAMYLARTLTRHSLPAIGCVLNRHHTTILHGCRRVETLRRQDPELDADINALIERLTPTRLTFAEDQRRESRNEQ